MINLLIEADRVVVLKGTPRPVDVPRDDGSVQRIFRCPECQIAVFSEYSRKGIWFVRGGTLDDPTDVVPDVHIFTRSKVGWVAIPSETPAFEVYYDTKKLWPAASPRASRRGSSARLIEDLAEKVGNDPRRDSRGCPRPVKRGI